MKTFRSKILTVVMVLGILVSLSQADVVLLNDKFLDGSLGNGTNPGELDTAWYGVNTNAAGTAWIYANVSATSYLPVAAGTMYEAGGSATNTTMWGSFATTTLTNPGDVIEVKLNMVVGTVTTTGSFWALLGYDHGTPITSNEFGTPTNSADDVFNVPFSLTNSANFTQTTTPYTFVERYELAENGTSLLVTATLDGTVKASTTYASPSTLTFNELGLLWQTKGVVDNIEVTYIPVPEPTTLGLIALGAMGMFRRKKM